MEYQENALSMDGCYTLVVGSRGGFGSAVAESLTSAGATVIGMDLPNRSGAAEAVPTLGVDITDPASVAAAFRDLTSRVPQLDVLVNTAGIREIEPIDRLEPATWARVLATKLTGPFLCIQAALPLMRAAGSASVVNIASVGGVIGLAKRPAYTASKHGLVGLTRNLAHDLGPDGIRVNAIAPGTMRTQMTESYYTDESFLRQAEAMVPLGFDGTAADVADAVLFLSSGLARHVTGVVLPVDGGWLAQKNYAPLGAATYHGAAPTTSTPARASGPTRI